MKASQFILFPKTPPVHLLQLEVLHVDAVEGPRVDGQFAAHKLDRAEGVVEPVRDLDAAGGAEGVFGRFGAESVDGQMGAVVEFDVFFGGVEPEGGVLKGFFSLCVFLGGWCEEEMVMMFCLFVCLFVVD